MELRDDFEREVQLDPMVLFKPKCEGIRAFLSSPAKIRYLHSGNRYGKTAAAMADNYYLLTGAHPYRPIPKFPSSVIMIGPDYTNYAQMVFEPKYIDGEPDSYLTPVFPHGGRWLHSYNKNNKTLALGCAECAARLKSKECPHPKPKLYLCSDLGKPESIAGGQHGKLAIDEIVGEEFYLEGMQRLKATLGSYCDVTLTPTHGEAWWTYERLKVPHDDPEYKNEYIHPLLRKKVKYIEVFTGSQYEGGLVPHSEIDAEVAALERQEGGYEIIRLRIYGEHVSLGTHKVFDQEMVRQQRQNILKPKTGTLTVPGEDGLNSRELLRDFDEVDKLEWKEVEAGQIYVWAPPEPGEQYVIGADVAHGLTRGDYSVAHVYQMRPLDGKIHLEHVAKFRGHINPVNYAYEILKLSKWYNDAFMAPERNGPGHTVIHELVEELFCYNIYQGLGRISDVSAKEETIYGVTMSGETKPAMISLAANTWSLAGRSYITTYDAKFLYEMEHYIQERSEKGLTIRYHGEGNCHDDEVSAFLVANYVVRTLPDVYDYDRGTAPDIDPYARMSPKQAAFWRQVHKQIREQEDYDPW
jgi:hypothetical protein